MFDHFFKAFQQKPCEILPFMDSLSQLGRIKMEGLVEFLLFEFPYGWALKTETKDFISEIETFFWKTIFIFFNLCHGSFIPLTFF